MARTLVTGNILRSGSIPTTALGGGVVTSSAQIVSALPGGTLSSSAQVTNVLPADVVSSSVQVTAFLPVNTVSSSGQVTTFLPTNTVSSSGQVTAFLPTGTVSSSTQLPSGIASSSAQVTEYLPTGTVSSSGQVNVFSTVGGNTLATTGSNTFTGVTAISDTTNSTSYLNGALTVAGGMSVQKDMRISGSMTINGLLTVVSMSSQYVTSSQYNIGVSKVTVNDDDNVRFAGLSVFDSGSSSPATASIFWDSLQHRFIYENLSGSSYNSAILIAGPKNTGSLGDESTLTTGYLPVATGDDHIANSIILQSNNSIGIGTTNPGGALTVKIDSIANTFLTFRSSGNNQIWSHTGGTAQPLTILASSLTFADDTATRMVVVNGNVGIGTTAPGSNKLHIVDSASPGVNGLSIKAAGATGTYPFRVTWANGTEGDMLTVNDNGNVGIGTTNPQYKLSFGSSGDKIGYYSSATVYSNIELFNGSTANMTFTMQNSAGGSFVFTGGNVGIGTTSPNAALSIYSTTTAGLNFRNSSNVGTTYGFALEASGNDSEMWNYANGWMRFGTNNNERVRITASGNVGVGTTNPSSKLHIEGGNITNTGLPATVNTAKRGIDISTNDLAGSTGNAGVYVSAPYGGGTTNQAFFRVKRGASDIYNGAEIGFSNTFRILGSTTEDSSEYFRITGAGNVGIGVTNPSAKLDVRSGNIALSDPSSTTGAGYAIEWLSNNGGTQVSYSGIDAITTSAGARTGDLRFLTSNAGAPTEKVRIKSNGNVGIGTNNPESIFHVRNTATNLNAIFDAASNGGYLVFREAGTDRAYLQWGLTIAGSANGNYLLLSNAENGGNIALQTRTSGGTANNAALVVDSNGNVGIGSSSPEAILHIAKSTSAGVGGQLVIDNPAASATGNTAELSFLTDDGASGTGTRNARILTINENANSGAARMELHTWDGGTSAARLTIKSGGNVGIGTTDPSSFKLQVAGNIGPEANGTRDLGSSSLRWSTVYTSDLSLSNGIGDWTIVEGEDDLFIYNNKNNKVYKFTLQEVDPSTATPKKS